MYHRFFGLSKDPFGMTPDPAFLFLTAEHREALASITYSILSRKGFVVLTGDAGTGKTTLLGRIFQSIPSTRARFSVVLNPTLTPIEFLEVAMLDFGIANIPPSKAKRLTLLEQFLIDSFHKHELSVLVVDEAHKLQPEVLEEIRLLSNVERPEAKLLQVVLAGQTELGDVLNRHDLRQLKQRIAFRLAIHPLSRGEVAQYIHHRWQKAGSAKPHPFQPEAVARIAQCSRGIPRLVNVLCDNALMTAYGENRATIGPAQIGKVARDLDLLDGPGVPSRAGAIPEPPRLERRPPAQVDRPGNRVANGAISAPRRARVLVPWEYQNDMATPSVFRRLAAKLGFSPKPKEQSDLVPRID